GPTAPPTSRESSASAKEDTIFSRHASRIRALTIARADSSQATLRPTMAKEGQTAGLDGMVGALKNAGQKGPPPVHLWNPPYCGEIDMRIAADGTWFYQKTPIGRAALVKLFASVLKREGERYFLVTPVEKCGITVDETPFLAVELAVDEG